MAVETPSIEESILNTIDAGEGSGTPTPNESGDEGGGEEEGTQDTTQAGGSGGDSTSGAPKPAAKQPAGKPGQQPKPNQQQQQGKEFRDPRTGEVIKPGAERRLWEKAQNAERAATHWESEARRVADMVTHLRRENDTLKQAASAGQQFNLSPEESITAHKLMASWKQNPVETAKYLLAQVRQMGHNIEGIGGGVDIRAIQQMVQEAIKPFAQDREARSQQERVQAETQREVNEFFARFPDARIHEQSLARMIQLDSRMTLDAAYYRLRNAFIERGLDWSKPLNSQQPTADNQSGDHTTMPQGRGNGASVAPRTSSYARPEDTWADIVRGAMDEARRTQ